MWLDIESDARQVVDCCTGPGLAATVQKLGRTLDAMRTCRREGAEVIARAREMYADENCEIDDEPIVAPGRNGSFVSAWVWVPADPS